MRLLIILFIFLVGSLKSQQPDVYTKLTTSMHFDTDIRMRNGDIIFTKINSIFYNQIGLIFVEHDTTFVYYADQVVFRMTLHQYLNSFKHTTKRLDIEVMTDEVIETMRSFVKSKENKAYNNAKFVWDAYRYSTGIPLCKRSDITVRNINRCYFLE